MIGKFAPNLRGFPTPDTADEIESYLVFYFTDDTWSQWVLGALESMVYDYNWYQSGEMTPEEAAEAFRLIIQQAPYNILPKDVPAPFWDEDSGDDSDDSAPIADQPWYGQLVLIDDNLTFVENAFIYVVAGFIAYAGLPTAAISFIPIARNFVVTFKSNPLGGIIKFFADGVAIGQVDTYSADDGVVSAPLTLPAGGMGFVAEDTSPVFWAELSDENPHGLESVSMTLIRSRLSESQLGSTSYRYNSDCSCVQYSPDGGTTWNNAPGSDPRSAPQFRFPARTQYDLLLCALYCTCDTSGRWDDTRLVNLQAKITATMDATAAAVVNLFLTIQGAVGLSNAGAIGTETADCSGCDCGWCRASDYLTTEDLANMTNEGGTWSIGDGYVGTSYIGFDSFSQQYPSPLTPVTVTHLEMQYSASGFGSGGNVSLQLYLGGVQQQIVTSTTAGAHQTIVWDGSQSIDRFYLTCGSHDSGGVVKLEKWKLEGLGDVPDIGQLDCS